MGPRTKRVHEQVTDICHGAELSIVFRGGGSKEKDAEDLGTIRSYCDDVFKYLAHVREYVTGE